MDQAAFDQIWGCVTEFKPKAAATKQRCIYAQHFGSWTEVLYQEEAQAPTLMGIHQKMLMLTLKYFEWRAVVPKAHRDHISERRHICIFSIFERMFHQLKVLELSLNPPLLLPPPPPPSPIHVEKNYLLTSFPLGEVEEEEDGDE
jgi:hypothetical protein